MFIYYTIKENEVCYIEGMPSVFKGDKSASTKATIVCKIPNNAQITVCGNSNNGFYKVKYGCYTGYASNNFIIFEKTIKTQLLSQDKGLL